MRIVSIADLGLTAKAAGVFTNIVLMTFKHHFNATRTGNIQFQFCSLAQFPALQHIDAITLQKLGNVHSHVLHPVSILRNAIFKWVHRLVTFYGEIACRMVKGCHTLFKVVVGYRSADINFLLHLSYV